MEALPTDAHILVEFQEIYKEEYEAAKLITKNIDDLCRIYKNINLYQAIRVMPSVKILMRGAKARAQYNTAATGSALLLFPDIPMYVVVPRNSVDEFAAKIAWYNGPIMHLVREVDMKQFTFICSDLAQSTDVLKYTRLCFESANSPIYHTGNQVCVPHVPHLGRLGVTIHGHHCAMGALRAYFERHGTRACSEAIHSVNTVDYDGIAYVRCLCNDFNGLHLRT